jgi:hypothetical protein
MALFPRNVRVNIVHLHSIDQRMCYRLPGHTLPPRAVTMAIACRDGKPVGVAVARCCPTDTFDARTGARLAVARLAAGYAKAADDVDTRVNDVLARKRRIMENITQTLRQLGQSFARGGGGTVKPPLVGDWGPLLRGPAGAFAEAILKAGQVQPPKPSPAVLSLEVGTGHDTPKHMLQVDVRMFIPRGDFNNTASVRERLEKAFA